MNERKRGAQPTMLACTVRQRLSIFDIPMAAFTAQYGERAIYWASDMVSFVSWYLKHNNVFHQHHRPLPPKMTDMANKETM